MKQARILVKRGKAAPALFALFALVALLAAPVPASAGGDPILCADISPSGEIAVANNNLEERDIGDMDDPRDMQIFVDRLIDGAGSADGYEIPYTPDVLLFQEMRHKSAQVLAGLLFAETGCRFVVAVSPGDQYVVQVGDHAVIKETGILLNANTMESLDAGGHVITKYSLRHSSPQKRVFKNNAFGYAKEIQSGLTISLASVHFVKDSSLKNADIAKKKKEAWSRQVARKLAMKYPNADMSSIGGDFNAHRCSGQDPDCNGAPFWRALHEDFKYKDTYYEMKDFGHYIDYIWGKKFVVNANEDTKYDHSGADHDPIYSDHQFRWAVLANQDTSPPSPFKIFGAEGYGGTNPRIQIKWTQSFDGAGMKGYEVWRAPADTKASCGEFKLAKEFSPNDTRVFEDQTVAGRDARCYYVKAIDKLGNERRATINLDPAHKSDYVWLLTGADTVIVGAGDPGF
jgi:hypothetical protein